MEYVNTYHFGPFFDILFRNKQQIVFGRHLTYTLQSSTDILGAFTDYSSVEFTVGKLT